MAAAGATRRLLSPDLVEGGQRGGDPSATPGSVVGRRDPRAPGGLPCRRRQPRGPWRRRRPVAAVPRGRGGLGPIPLTCSADGAGPVLDHVGPGPAQIADRFFRNGGDADRYQFPGPVQPRQPPESRRSVLISSPGPGDQRRRDHLAAHVHACQQPGHLEAGRTSLVAGSQPAGSPGRPTSLRPILPREGSRSASGRSRSGPGSPPSWMTHA
jgi:hypothetical protein